MESNALNTIEMVRKIRSNHARRLAGKTHAERMSFYQQMAQKMEKRIPGLLSVPGLEKGTNSGAYPMRLEDQQLKPIANRVSEKGINYKP